MAQVPVFLKQFSSLIVIGFIGVILMGCGASDETPESGENLDKVKSLYRLVR